MVEYYLFDNPWPLAGALLAAAAVVWLVQRARETPTTRRLVGGLPLLAGLLLLSAWLIETDREAVERSLGEMLAAAEKHDAAGVLSYFDLPEKPADRTEWGRNGLAREVSARINQLKRANLHSPEITLDGMTARCEMEAGMYGDGWGPVVVVADLQWEKRNGRWRIVHMRDAKWRIGASASSPVGPYR